MLRLSKHFIENWEKRVGAIPAPADVQRMTHQAVRLQKGFRVFQRGRWFNTLSLYWHTGLDLVISIDHFTGTAVSVYSKTMNQNTGRG